MCFNLLQHFFQGAFFFTAEHYSMRLPKFVSLMHLEFYYGLVKVFINDLDTGVESIMFADDTKLGGDVESLKGNETLQKDLKELKGRIITKCMKF